MNEQKYWKFEHTRVRKGSCVEREMLLRLDRGFGCRSDCCRINVDIGAMKENNGGVCTKRGHGTKLLGDTLREPRGGAARNTVSRGFSKEHSNYERVLKYSLWAKTDGGLGAVATG